MALRQPPSKRWGWNHDLMLSVMQKAMRRGQVETALQVAAEQLCSGRANGVLSRCLLYAAEDYGPGEPTLLMTLTKSVDEWQKSVKKLKLKAADIIKNAALCARYLGIVAWLADPKWKRSRAWPMIANRSLQVHDLKESGHALDWTEIVGGNPMTTSADKKEYCDTREEKTATTRGKREVSVEPQGQNTLLQLMAAADREWVYASIKSSSSAVQRAQRSMLYDITEDKSILRRAFAIQPNRLILLHAIALHTGTISASSSKCAEPKPLSANRVQELLSPSLQPPAIGDYCFDKHVSDYSWRKIRGDNVPRPPKHMSIAYFLEESAFIVNENDTAHCDESKKEQLKAWISEGKKRYYALEREYGQGKASSRAVRARLSTQKSETSSDTEIGRKRKSSSSSNDVNVSKKDESNCGSARSNAVQAPKRKPQVDEKNVLSEMRSSNNFEIKLLR